MFPGLRPFLHARTTFPDMPALMPGMPALMPGQQRLHTMWMPRSCCKSCMNAATMQFGPGAGEASVTEVRTS